MWKKIKLILNLEIQDVFGVVPLTIQVEKISNGFLLKSGRNYTNTEFYKTPEEFKKAISNIINDKINNLKVS